MSKSIVSPETMNLAVIGIEYASEHTWNPEKLCGFNEAVEPITPTGLAQRLYRLNRTAMEARYPGDEDRARIPADYRHPQDAFSNFRVGAAPHPTSRQHAITAYKAMCHLRHQCAEADIPRTNPDYAYLLAAMHVLAECIVCGVPEYEAAGIEGENRRREQIPPG